jgi:hypothetical protein
MVTVTVVGAPRDPCPDLEPDCFELPFCEAWLCAVELRRGLTGELAHCPVSGIAATVQYGPGGPSGQPH